MITFPSEEVITVMKADAVEIIKTKISVVTMAQAKTLLLESHESGAGGYVCFSNVHTVVESRYNSHLREATNHALLACPDGRPLSMFARLQGVENIEQVAGPDFMPYFIENAPNLTHYFVGSTEETLEKLVTALRQMCPEIKVAGTLSPPFAPLVGEVNEKILQAIKEAGPDVVWVGLGAPKQEIWMYENFSALKPALLMGVGAAFDFYAGNKKRAPAWMRKWSLEWLFRLLSEPGRLWRRYLTTNSYFVFWVIKQLLTGTKPVIEKGDLHKGPL